MPPISNLGIQQRKPDDKDRTHMTIHVNKQDYITFRDSLPWGIKNRIFEIILHELVEICQDPVQRDRLLMNTYNGILKLADFHSSLAPSADSKEKQNGPE